MLCSIWDHFDTVTLDQLASVALLSRTDAKYILHRSVLPQLADSIRERYSVLSIENQQEFQYRTIYYDTPDLRCYHDHHHDRSGRYKIRTRHYIDSNCSFDEIKRRTKKGTTEKFRLERSGDHRERFQHQFTTLIHSLTKASATALQPSMEVRYVRTTLADLQSGTRMTIDSSLEAVNEHGRIVFPGLVIAEVKSTGRHNDSTLRMNGIIRSGISKYCLAVASLYPEIRKNRFQPKLRQIEKIVAIHDNKGDSHGSIY